jgi:hypothetical protein
VEIRLYKAIILPLVLNGCHTLSLTLRDEQRLGVFENRVLRRIFGPKRDDVLGGRRKMQNVELHNVHTSLSVIRMITSRRMRWAGHSVLKIIDGIYGRIETTKRTKR